MGFAVRKLLVRVEAAAELGVCVPVPLPFSRPCGVPSSLEGSGVAGRLLALLKLGRRRDVRDGDGGSGVGGLL